MIQPAPRSAREHPRAAHTELCADASRRWTRARVAFVVNGGESSAMGERARAFAARIGEELDARVAYRDRGKVRAIREFWRFLRSARPAVSYVLDMSVSGVVAAALDKALRGTRVVIDTGDAIYELTRSAGGRGRLGEWATWLLEACALRVADLVVVRGTLHRELLRTRGVEAVVVQDGVECDAFSPETDVARATGELRRALGVEGVLSVGMLGSSVWSKRLGICYGWDLVEAIRLLPDVPVRGVIVGGGSGIDVLRARCREYGIEDRITFVERVPYEQLPDLLAAVDVWTSTQTNDVPGRVRTTGKLPLYLAAGRFVLASRVGEASLVLDDLMLVDYQGVVDVGYPARLAERIRSIARDPGLLERGRQNVRLARERFDYDVLARRVGDVLTTLSRGGRTEVAS